MPSRPCGSRWPNTQIVITILPDGKAVRAAFSAVSRRSSGRSSKAPSSSA
jgi:hypothetical protein